MITFQVLSQQKSAKVSTLCPYIHTYTQQDKHGNVISILQLGFISWLLCEVGKFTCLSYSSENGFSYIWGSTKFIVYFFVLLDALFSFRKVIKCRELEGKF